MAKGKEIMVGILTLLVFSTLIYATWPEMGLRIKVEKTKTTFMINESGKWAVTGVETNKLYNGTKSVGLKSATVSYSIFGNYTEIIRNANYSSGAQVVDIYTFIGNATSREEFPVKHKVQIINGKGLIYQWQVSNLDYNGSTVKDITSPQVFGKMKVEWQNGSYYSKITKLLRGGQLTVKYKVGSNYESYYVRLFDPYLNLTNADNLADVFGQDNSVNRTVFIKWNISSLPASQTIDNGTICQYIFRVDGAGIDNDVSVWYVSNQSWDESIIVAGLNALVKSNNTNTTMTSITTSTWSCFDVTTQLKEAYSKGNKNFTIAFIDLDYPMGTATDLYDTAGNIIGGSVGSAIFENRENSRATGNFSYLNITYSAEGDTTPPNITVRPYTGTYLTKSLAVNGTLDEAGNCKYSLNSGTTNVSMINISTTQWNSNGNVTFAEGVNTLTLYCNDTAKNPASNSTTITVDSVLLTVNFISPTKPNGSTILTDSYMVNVSVSKNVSSCILTWGVPSVSTPFVWVANYDDNTIMKLDLNGNIVGTYAVPPNPPGVAVDVFGNAWVICDTSDFVTKLNSSGSQIGNYTVGSAGNFPYSIAVDADGNVWVTSSGRNILIKLNSTGSQIGNYTVGGILQKGIAIDSLNNIWVAIYDKDIITKLNSSGSQIGNYSANDPEAIAIDFSNVWIAGRSGVLTSLTLSGDYRFNSTISDAQFGIAVDAFGNVWVTNYYKKIVTKLNSSGSQIGNYSVGTFPYGIAVDAFGNVWVSNSGSKNITKLNSSGSQMGNYSVGSAPLNSGDFTGFALQYFVLGYGIETINYTNTMNVINADASTTAWYNVTSLISEKAYIYRVMCNDTYGNSNKTENRTITSDTTPPTINIIFPLNATYTTTSLAVNATLSEAGNCKYSLNAGSTNVSMTNTSTTAWFSTANLTAVQGSNQIYLYCNDTAGNPASNSTIFFIDSISPTINITLPLNQTYTTTSLGINVTIGEAGNCLYSLNAGSTNVSMTNTSTTAWFSTANATFAQGSNTITAYCNDSTGNKNSTTRMLVVDTVGPAITINRPSNKSYASGVNFNFSATLSEAGKCYLKLDAVNYSMVNSSTTAWNLTNSSILDGGHNASFVCNDTIGNWNQSEVLFTIDSVLPTITIVAPLSGIYSTSEFNFNVTLNEAGNCLAEIDSANYSMVNWSVSEWGRYNSSIQDGWHSVRYHCNDTAGNWNQSSLVDFVVDTTAPTITINIPLNKSYFINSLMADFTLDESGKCKYSLDQGVNNVSMIIDTATHWYSDNFTVSDGSYNLTAYCNDSVGNKNQTKVVFNVDTVGPTILLKYPENQANFTVDQVYFNATITPTGDNLTNATLYIYYNNLTLYISNISNLSGTNAITTNWTINFTFGDYYNWSVRGCSLAGCNFSLNRTVNVNLDATFSISNGTLFEFFPVNYTQMNVPAYNQTGAKGVFNITNRNNYGINITMSINETNPLINIKAGNNSNSSRAVNLSTSTQIIIYHLNATLQHYIWMWVDFWNATIEWSPELMIDWSK